VAVRGGGAGVAVELERARGEDVAVAVHVDLALAARLDELLANEDMRRTMGAAGMAKVRGEYSWDGIVERVYEPLLEGEDEDKSFVCDAQRT
jgi:glycosyltransferase involved in cell wall biosynthesis